MSQPLSSVLPETEPDRDDRRGRRDRAPVIERIAGWSARHRKTAVFGWLALVAVVFVAGQALGTKSMPGYDPGQSGQAERVLHRLGVSSPATEDVLVQARQAGRTLTTDPAMRHAVSEVAAGVARLPHAATGIRSPLAGGSHALVSADGRSALVTFQVPGPVADQATTVAPAQRAVAAVAARHPGLRIAEGGDASAAGRSTPCWVGFPQGGVHRGPDHAGAAAARVRRAGRRGHPAAAGHHLGDHRAVTADPISQWLPVGSGTSEVVLIIGMAVGVDYSAVLPAPRARGAGQGRAPGQALRVAAATSGRAVVVSGLTVMIALAGLFLSGYDLFSGVAFGTIIVVGVAVLGSLTVLPALLAGWAASGPRPGPVPWPQADRRPPVPRCGPRWCAGSFATRWCGARRRPSRCSRWPRPRSACGSVTRRRPARQRPGRADSWTRISAAFPAARRQPRWS